MEAKREARRRKHRDDPRRQDGPPWIARFLAIAAAVLFLALLPAFAPYIASAFPVPGGEAPEAPPAAAERFPAPPVSIGDPPHVTGLARAPEAPPTPEPSPTPAPSAAERLLADMAAREKIYQLFSVFAYDLPGVSELTAAGEQTRAALERYPVGGLLYDADNMETREQIRTMLDTTRTYSRIPLLFACDEEGGRVSRLMRSVGTPRVGPMLDYHADGPEKARENARTIAGGLISCGFNWDLAPVADVWTDTRNTVIGNRAYSTDFEEAAELIGAAVEGFHAGGAACTLKHFPGHGGTAEDSHYGSAYVHRTLEELRAGEFLPFAAGIRAGADAVMIGHLIVEDIDSEPAPFSYRIVTELLREELGFQGVIVTDSLQMEAMTKHYGSGEAAVRALLAGVDMLLCPANLKTAAEAVWEALETGRLAQARLDESVLRILRMKEAMGLLKSDFAGE